MGIVMEICPFDQEIRPSRLGLAQAFSQVIRHRYRNELNVQGCIVRDFGLTADIAKGLMKGKTSVTTMEQVLQHKNGGWRVGLAVLGIVIGARLTDYFTSERMKLQNEAEQRRRKAELLAEAESFLHATDGGPSAPRLGSDLDPRARGAMAACAT